MVLRRCRACPCPAGSARNGSRRSKRFTLIGICLREGFYVAIRVVSSNFAWGRKPDENRWSETLKRSAANLALAGGEAVGAVNKERGEFRVAVLAGVHIVGASCLSGSGYRSFFGPG